ncbi:DUF2846 domain-containing protein [Pseudomonas sp. 5P_3.1_Bac2]|uniref:DUF2846 domain-containing protein n=1 Tax=Pseudomonas sp. 5P_3.1_Bac2 TaxID=2971617 RepID=UPI0021C8DCF7|nr:DUF2846 domain-containing protein [Pseudomonas sp. 5P_3.1_Bac2]MCU1716420.1 DUF2846 domain-containing protein [Pseudomonas sp. 5P_3.1_Bac2]
MSKSLLLCASLSLALLAGCASVPMASTEQDQQSKTFSAPPPDQSGLYIFRDSILGAALKKTVKVDGEVIGETASNTYFYRLIKPGQHLLSTESEFSDNSIELYTEPGKNYYVRQSIKLGVFVGGAKLKVVDEAEGQEAVASTQQAQ